MSQKVLNSGHLELFRRMGAHHMHATAPSHSEDSQDRLYRDKTPTETYSIKHEIGPKRYKSGGNVKRQDHAVGAVAKIRKDQY